MKSVARVKISRTQFLFQKYNVAKNLKLSIKGPAATKRRDVCVG